MAQQEDDKSTVTLSALRRDRGRDKRVAVLVGGTEAVQASLESALPYSEALETSDILIVPLVLEDRPRGRGSRAAMGSSEVAASDRGWGGQQRIGSGSGVLATSAASFEATGGENDLESAVGRSHVALPVALNRWQEYVDTEVGARVCFTRIDKRNPTRK